MDNLLIGKRIKAVRVAKQLNQKTFSSSLGVSQSFLSGVERGLYSPGTKLFLSINCYFHVNLNWLLTGDGPMYIEEKGLPAVRAAPEIDPEALPPWMGDLIEACQKNKDLAEGLRIFIEGEQRRLEGERLIARGLRESREDDGGAANADGG